VRRDLRKEIGQKVEEGKEKELAEPSHKSREETTERKVVMKKTLPLAWVPLSYRLEGQERKKSKGEKKKVKSRVRSRERGSHCNSGDFFLQNSSRGNEDRTIKPYRGRGDRLRRRRLYRTTDLQQFTTREIRFCPLILKKVIRRKTNCHEKAKLSFVLPPIGAFHLRKRKLKKKKRRPCEEIHLGRRAKKAKSI